MSELLPLPFFRFFPFRRRPTDDAFTRGSTGSGSTTEAVGTDAPRSCAGWKKDWHRAPPRLARRYKGWRRAGRRQRPRARAERVPGFRSRRGAARGGNGPVRRRPCRDRATRRRPVATSATRTAGTRTRIAPNFIEEVPLHAVLHVVEGVSVDHPVAEWAGIDALTIGSPLPGGLFFRSSQSADAALSYRIGQPCQSHIHLHTHLWGMGPQSIAPKSRDPPGRHGDGRRRALNDRRATPLIHGRH